MTPSAVYIKLSSKSGLGQEFCYHSFSESLGRGLMIQAVCENIVDAVLLYVDQPTMSLSTYISAMVLTDSLGPR